MPLKSNLSYMW